MVNSFEKYDSLLEGILEKHKQQETYINSFFNSSFYSTLKENLYREGVDYNILELRPALRTTISLLIEYRSFILDASNLSDLKKDYEALKKSLIKVYNLLQDDNLLAFLRSLENIDNQKNAVEGNLPDSSIDQLMSFFKILNLSIWGIETASIDKTFNDSRKYLQYGQNSVLFSAAHKSKYGESYIIASVMLNFIRESKIDLSLEKPASFWITNAFIRFLKDTHPSYRKLTEIDNSDYFYDLL